MTVFLLAQAGVPLTSGFVAKFGVIQAGVGVHSYALSIIAMITAVIAAFLYLRIMISMWATPDEAGDDDREAVRIPVLAGIAIFASARSPSSSGSSRRGSSTSPTASSSWRSNGPCRT